MINLQGVKDAFSSRQAFNRAIQTKAATRTDDAERTHWENEDLQLSPPEQWTWKWFDFAAFWFSYGHSIEVWAVGGSMISAGLTWWQALICVFISHLLGAIGVATNSRPAAAYHMGFPVNCRTQWGMWGSYFPVAVRLIVGIIWTGVLIYEGGIFVDIILRCIFGHHWTDIENTIPTSQGITTRVLAGTILFWILTSPGLAIRPHKIRLMFVIKSGIMPIAFWGLFIFCMMKGAKGVGNFGSDVVPAKGGALGWLMLSVINSTMGKTTPNMTNQADLARYANKKSAPFWSQILSLPFGNTLIAALGILGTSAIRYAWDVTLWNPWDLCNEILDREWGGGTRFAIFLFSVSVLLSIFADNYGSNIISFAVDITSMCPRYFNIRRGMFLAYAIGLAVCPWKLLASAQTFLTFLGGYSLFVGPVVGISICDYFLVRKGNLDVTDMFTSSSTGRYWYTKGVHWRAFVTYICGIVVPLPGFVAAFGYDIPIGAQRIYSIGWILSIVISITLYYALSFVGGLGKDERAGAFESWIPDWVQYWEERGVIVAEVEGDLVEAQSMMVDTKLI